MGGGRHYGSWTFVGPLHGSWNPSDHFRAQHTVRCWSGRHQFWLLWCLQTRWQIVVVWHLWFFFSFEMCWIEIYAPGKLDVFAMPATGSDGRLPVPQTSTRGFFVVVKSRENVVEEIERSSILRSVHECALIYKWIVYLILPGRHNLKTGKCHKMRIFLICTVSGFIHTQV